MIHSYNIEVGGMLIEMIEHIKRIQFNRYAYIIYIILYCYVLRRIHFRMFAHSSRSLSSTFLQQYRTL